MLPPTHPGLPQVRHATPTVPVPNRDGWRYFATTLNGDGTETLLATDLPLTDVSLTRVLSGVDEADATVPVEVDRLRGSTKYSLFRPWSTALYATLGGVIRWGGIVVDAPIDGPKISLKADGFRGYLGGLPFGGDKSYVQADSFDIARDIWSWVQAQQRGDLGLSLRFSAAKSGVRLGRKKKDVEFQTGEGEDVSFESGPYKQNWWDTHDLGKAWDDLAEAGRFDYYETHVLDGDTIRHTLHIDSPTSGRRRTDLRFVVGENVTEVPSIEVDGDDYTDEMIVLGAGEGRKMARGSWPVPSDRLHRPKIVTDKGYKSDRAAAKQAEVLAKRYQGEDSMTSLVVRNHNNAPLGSWSLGDVITVRGNGTGWAGDQAMAVQIMSYTLEPDKGEQATLSVTRAERVA